MSRRKIAYADPPYPGCSHLYKGHPDYAGEVDHASLVARLVADYDGFILHTSSSAWLSVAKLLEGVSGVRSCAWVKPFAAFKRNVSVAYAWEPVFVRAVRKPVVAGHCVMRDFVSCSITMRKGLVGAKPPEVIRWAIEIAGLQPGDELDDLFPGTGIVRATWERWREGFGQLELPRTRGDDDNDLLPPDFRAGGGV